MAEFTPRSWLQLSFDVAVLSYMSAFSLVSLSYCAAMWQLRKEFFIALRSPMLAVISGVTGILVSWASIFHRILDYTQEAGAEMFFFSPLMLCFTAAYVMRGLRLLVMYNPLSRQRWGPFSKERSFLAILLGVFLALQVVVWSFVPGYGVASVAEMMPIVSTFDMLLTVVASAVLHRKMDEINDLFNTSKEIMTVGFFSILSLAIAAGMVAIRQVFDQVPHRGLLFFFMIIRFHTATWITNVKPVRDVLRQSSDRKDHRVPWFPHLPWGRSVASKVAIGTDESNPGQSVDSESLRKHQRGRLGALDPIMSCPPLLEAFDSFCRKALCGESIMFLKEVAAFRDSNRAAEGEGGEGALFKAFVAIANKFIRSGSSYEVNIDGRARANVMRYVEEPRFEELRPDDKAGVFTEAETQTSHMLADNLLAKFQATAEYQRIAEGLLAIASGDEERTVRDAVVKYMSPRRVESSRELLKTMSGRSQASSS